MGVRYAHISESHFIGMGSGLQEVKLIQVEKRKIGLYVTILNISKKYEPHSISVYQNKPFLILQVQQIPSMSHASEECSRIVILLFLRSCVRTFVSHGASEAQLG